MVEKQRNICTTTIAKKLVLNLKYLGNTDAESKSDVDSLSDGSSVNSLSDGRTSNGSRSIDLFRTRPRQILAQCEWCTQNNDYGGQFAITDVNANIS